MAVKDTITQKLTEAFMPVYLDVKDESYMHSSGAGAESHFKVTVISDEFKGKALLARHRHVNAVMDDELKNKIHALAIHAHTCEEWERKGNTVPNSPACLGGSKG